MLAWMLQTFAIAGLAAVAVLCASRVARIGPVGRHVLWLVVLVKLVTPPLVIVEWPWA
jgi:hypothetical protein